MKKILFLIIFIIGCNNTNETKQKKNDLPFWEVKFHRKNTPTSLLKVKIMIKEKAIGIKLYENDNKESIKVSMQEPIEYKINIKHNNNDIDFNFRGIHENNVVIIEPWELGGDTKGDIIYKYRGKAEVDFLKKKGYLKNIDQEF